jgi:hypothetical protein
MGGSESSCASCVPSAKYTLLALTKLGKRLVGGFKRVSLSESRRLKAVVGVLLQAATLGLSDLTAFGSHILHAANLTSEKSSTPKAVVVSDGIVDESFKVAFSGMGEAADGIGRSTQSDIIWRFSLCSFVRQR